METLILLIGGALAAFLVCTDPEPPRAPGPPAAVTPADVRVFEWAGCKYHYIVFEDRAEMEFIGECENGK